MLPGGLLKGLGLSPVRFYELFPYMSEVRVLGARRRSFFYGLRGFDFSYDEVKRAVVIGFIGFFLCIVSAAKGFLYLKQITDDYKKKREKKRTTKG